MLLAGLSFWQYNETKYQYGLDVQGGVRFTLQIKYPEDPKEAAALRADLPNITRNLKETLERRAAQGLGVVEAVVTKTGEDGFAIEVPGFTDENKARALIISTAKIIAYHATNVTTSQATWREFSEAGDQKTEAGDPYVSFASKSNPSKVLGPRDPEYQAMVKGWTKILEGTDLASATPQVAPGKVYPEFSFSSEGSQKMKTWSQSVLNRGEKLAFVLDGIVLNIAPLKDGAVLEGGAYIDGSFDAEYVTRLCDLLNSGALPVDLTETSSAKVDPTIGQGALKQMVTAGAYAFGVITLFLLVYYSFPGFVALIALGLYILFTLTVLKLTGATFSLAAIAGFILSVGMAVDANILVFERAKEEMRDGRSLMTAVELGFKRAFPAILDSNACTILTSIVLFALGTGPVKGFATTLIIGVLISLFTAVVVTRSLLVFLVGSGIGNDPKYYAMDRSWFGEKHEATADTNPFQIMKRNKLWFMISIGTIIPGMIFLGLGGIKPNVEFSGGAEAVFLLEGNSNSTSASISESMEKAGIKGTLSKIATSEKGKVAYVTIPLQPGEVLSSPDFKKKVGDASGLGKAPDSFTTIGPTVARETVENAFKGILISTSLIVIYLAFRFGIALGGFKNGLKFGLSAILALVHDVLVVIGIAAIVGYVLKWEVSALFITAMLTVIGFSVHDTIVIFDRVRENLKRPLQGETFGHLCDRSITKSVARSLNTSMTVIATLIIMIAVGTPTPDLKFFCVTMLAGIVSGTFSSIFNATPILYLWDNMVGRTKGVEHTLIEEARRDQARLRNLQAEAAGDSNQSYATIKRKNRVKDQARRDIDDQP
jgi:SecD/SecF fusion protein